MSTVQEPVYQITAGPSKFDLMMAIFGKQGDHVLEFTFDCPTQTTDPHHSAICSQTAMINILSVSREDGSGESWNFRGNAPTMRVKGYFNTRTRRGHLIFVENETDVSEITFGGHIVFGFSRLLSLKGNYIAIKGENSLMVLGQTAVLRGDSRGYVPSGHKDGQTVTIIGFQMPFHRGETDCIVNVISDDGKSGWVKPSNIVLV